MRCESAAEVAAHATATLVACQQMALCQTIIPPCGPALTTAQGGRGAWYPGVELPSNVAELIGFRPELPTALPDGASWGSASLLAPSASPNHAGFLHGRYIPWPLPPPPKDLRDHAVLVIDETTNSLDPVADLQVGQQSVRLESQSPTTVGGAPATMYDLAYVYGGASGHVIELLWHHNALTLRHLRLVGYPGSMVLEHLPGLSASDDTGDALQVTPLSDGADRADVVAEENLVGRIANSIAPVPACSH